jgi:hypothetical protein
MLFVRRPDIAPAFLFAFFYANAFKEKRTPEVYGIELHF